MEQKNNIFLLPFNGWFTINAYRNGIQKQYKSVIWYSTVIAVVWYSVMHCTENKTRLIHSFMLRMSYSMSVLPDTQTATKKAWWVRFHQFAGALRDVWHTSYFTPRQSRGQDIWKFAGPLPGGWCIWICAQGKLRLSEEKLDVAKGQPLPTIYMHTVRQPLKAAPQPDFQWYCRKSHTTLCTLEITTV